MNPTVTALLILLQLLPSIPADYSSRGQCTPMQQREALVDANSCEPRPTLIDLREHLSNASAVIQVIPEYKTVAKCGGSCELYSHGCISTATRTKSIDVMVVRTQYDRSRTDIECGVIEVEEDTACSCNCPVQASDCSSDHYYDSSSCRCLCNDQSGRNRCISRGMQWDPHRCMCMCPTSAWRVCSSGYVYDFTDTCQCIPVVATSNAQGLAMFAALIICGVLTIISMFVYHKRQIRYYQRQLLKFEPDCQSIASSEDSSEDGSTCALTMEETAR